jgi:hypothetical protein
MAATKTIQLVQQVWQNTVTGETTQVSWNADDGALAGYTGPGPGWVMVSQDGTSDTVQDYSDYGVFASVYGTGLADQAVASGQINPPTLANSAPVAGPSPGNALFPALSTTPAGVKVTQVVAAPMPKLIKWLSFAGLAYAAYRLFL